MKAKTKKKSPLTKEIDDTIDDLRRLGLIDRRKQRAVKALDLKSIPEYAGEQIRALRKRAKVSQTVFASLLNTSASTVRKWEIGEKQPSGPSLKLPNLLDRKGLDALL